MESNLTDEDLHERLNENEAKVPFLKTGLKKEDSIGRNDVSRSGGRISISSKEIQPNRISVVTPKTHMSNTMNSIDSYEYELEKRNMSRILLPTSQPEQIFKGQFYSIVQCPVITTLFLSSLPSLPTQKFSYITTPLNNSKNFFLRKNPEEEKENLLSDLVKFQNSDHLVRFNICDSKWDVSKTNFKLSEDVLTNFLFELNYSLEPVNIKIDNIKKEFCQRKNVFSKIAMFSLITLVISLYSLYADLYIEEVFSYLFFFIFLFFTIISGVSLSYGLHYGICVERDEMMEYQILLNIINRSKNVEDLLMKWNKETFLPLGIIVSMPSTLNYIHFCLDPYSEIILNNHELK